MPLQDLLPVNDLETDSPVIEGRPPEAQLKMLLDDFLHGLQCRFAVRIDELQGVILRRPGDPFRASANRDAGEHTEKGSPEVEHVIMEYLSRH